MVWHGLFFLHEDVLLLDKTNAISLLIKYHLKLADFEWARILLDVLLKVFQKSTVYADACKGRDKEQEAEYVDDDAGLYNLVGVSLCGSNH